MEEREIQNDISLMCITAATFPEGIGEAFNSLLRILPDNIDRTFFGISYPDAERGIIYKAAVNQTFEGENVKLGCEYFVLRKGRYLTETVKQWRKNEAKIKQAFKTLGDADTRTCSPGIEWYDREDVMCMLRLEE